jgi:membrane-bound ClpP family serine protease
VVYVQRVKEGDVMNGLMILGIILFIAGFVFIGIEIVIPGFGAPGIIGCCCLVAGVFLTTNTLEEALVVIAIVLVLLVIFVFVLVTLLSKGKLKTPLVLHEKQKRENGYISSSDLQYLIGKHGITTTGLHPAGRVKIEDIEFDVISDGRFIEQGVPVEIYKISNSSLVVRRVEKDSVL